jgi:hypothetical protein
LWGFGFIRRRFFTVSSKDGERDEPPELPSGEQQTPHRKEWQEALLRSIGFVSLHWTNIHIHAHNIALALQAYQLQNHIRFVPGGWLATSILATALSHMEFREITALVKTLIVAVDLPQPLAKRITTALNQADNEIRSERNRYIHDQWQIFEDRVERFQPGSRTFKPQAFQAEWDFGRIKVFDSIPEMQRFVLEIRDADLHLASLWEELENFVREQRRPSQSPLPTPEAPRS